MRWYGYVEKYQIRRLSICVEVSNERGFALYVWSPPECEVNWHPLIMHSMPLCCFLLSGVRLDGSRLDRVLLTKNGQVRGTYSITFSPSPPFPTLLFFVCRLVYGRTYARCTEMVLFARLIPHFVYQHVRLLSQYSLVCELQMIHILKTPWTEIIVQRPRWYTDDFIHDIQMIHDK